MKKIKIKMLAGPLLLALVFFAACSKKLDVPPPNQINDQQIRDLLANGDESQVELIIGSMSNNMPLLFNKSGINLQGTADISYYTNQGLDVMRTLEANDMVLGISANLGELGELAGSVEYGLGNFQSHTNPRINGAYWYYAWDAITKANQLLSYLPDDLLTNNAFLQNAKARALVVRAYAYNYLMENYQDAYMNGGKTKLGMPLYTEFSPFQDYKARSTSDETYAQIKSDLTTAISLLQSSGTGYTADVSDIDMGVANFILARVALVTGDYPTVITTCNDILSHYPDLLSESHYGSKNTGTASDPVYKMVDNGFLNNDVNPEVILGFKTGVANTYFNNLMNVFGDGYGGINQAYKRVDERLYNEIAANDYRKDGFQGATAFGDFTYPTNGTVRTLPSYINYKFAATEDIGGDQKSPVKGTWYRFRSSEVLLMKAEAQASSGDNDGAKNTLDVLLAARTREGAPVLTTSNYSAMSGMTALEMVQFQTRIEMWGEGGLEFYNNKRWNIPVDRASSTNHTNHGSLPVSGMTIQIPDDEITNNPLMTQN